MSKDIILKSLKTLVEKYEQVKESNQIRKYTEEETKKDFILPLFEILGWNVFDRNEVSAEEHIASSGRVDYGFYLNGRAQFYLEAKSPKVDLNNEEYAKQAMRYSFNKGVTWAVLTDFESIKIFNAQGLSKYLGDKLFFEIKYSDYLNRLDQLWLLSKEAFAIDLIDKEAEKAGKKLQRVPITELLYKDLNECRAILTNYLGQWNPKVPKDLLDEGVQKLLDRLIFIRVAEDRKIEQNILVPLINQWRSLTGKYKPELYESMAKKFRELDEIYNSNLFSPHPFEHWEDDGGALEKVIDILHGKEGYYEYDFSIMPADVLGSVYENYLGYKLSQSKKGLTLDKSAGKRKEQGIYYTPTFIVDYIVKNALKPVLDKCKSVNDLKKIKVLDPACGSGSFLIKALEVIVDKYKEFTYEDDENLRTRIILENLFGVDLDEQAVEIARLNLLINALKQKGRLPSLDKNIKNGNSLISGTDKELEKYFGKNFRDKKPFNWEQKFPDVFKDGGFNVIIGNPPWVESKKLDKFDKEYFNNSYDVVKKQYDLFSIFIEKGLRVLKRDGILGFIVPNRYITNLDYEDFRKFLLNKSVLLRIIDLGDGIFKGVQMPSSIIVLQKSKDVLKNKLIVSNKIDGEEQVKSQEEFIKNKNFAFTIYEDGGSIGIIKKIEANAEEFRYFVENHRGVEIGKKNQIVSKTKDKEYTIPFLIGEDLDRYVIKGKHYLRLWQPKVDYKNKAIYQGNKILIRKTGIGIRAYLDREDFYVIQVIYIFRKRKNFEKINEAYFLGILNSKLMSFYYFNKYGEKYRKVFPHLTQGKVLSLPIHSLNLSDKNEKEKHDLIVEQVNKMLELNKSLATTLRNSNKWAQIKSDIEEVDKRIDEEVYKLYGLTPEEIETTKKL